MSNKLKLFFWLFISIGIFLRLAQFFSDRSLWFDEVLISLNIINKPFIELLGPLDYYQGAPAGFLFVEKVLVNIFGDSGGNSINRTKNVLILLLF